MDRNTSDVLDIKVTMQKKIITSLKNLITVDNKYHNTDLMWYKFLARLVQYSSQGVRKTCNTSDVKVVTSADSWSNGSNSSTKLLKTYENTRYEL